MAVESAPASEGDGARDALHTALAAYFAAERLNAKSTACFYGSALPSVALWVHSWHPLPDLVRWLAVLGWATLAVSAAVFAVAAVKRRAQAQAVAPEASRIARIHFAPGDGPPSSTVLLFALSFLASGVLWLDAIEPRSIRSDLVGPDATVWGALLVGAFLNRYFEGAAVI